MWLWRYWRQHLHWIRLKESHKIDQVWYRLLLRAAQFFNSLLSAGLLTLNKTNYNIHARGIPYVSLIAPMAHNKVTQHAYTKKHSSKIISKSQKKSTIPGSRFLRRFPVDAIWNYIPRTTLNENTKFVCLHSCQPKHTRRKTHTRTRTHKNNSSTSPSFWQFHILPSTRNGFITEIPAWVW